MQTRLTIMDHFMLDGVKALFKFTIAILHLSFQVSPPSSNDVIATIRNTAKSLGDTRILLPLIKRIKLPNSTYFAIKRSYYMVQSSFNSDLFYLQTLNNESSRSFDCSRPMSVQPNLTTKLPAKSLISSPLSQFAQRQQEQRSLASLCSSGQILPPRICTSSNRSKICVQNLGQRGRSHLRLINAQFRTNERCLISPLRNCLVIGISDCGRQIIMARQSSRRNFKILREQELIFHVHELSIDIFDGFFMEQQRMALIISHSGEIVRISYNNNNELRFSSPNCVQETAAVSAKAAFPAQNVAGSSSSSNQQPSSYNFVTETLLLRDLNPEQSKLKLKLTSLDPLTNLLWIYVECEEPCCSRSKPSQTPCSNQISTAGDLASGPNHGDRNEANQRINIHIQIPPKAKRCSAKVNPFNESPPKMIIMMPDDKIAPQGQEAIDKSKPPAACLRGQSSETSPGQKQQQQQQQQQPPAPAPPPTRRIPINQNLSNHHNMTVLCQRKILIVDTQAFDIFSAFNLHQNMGPILSMRTCLVAFCHFSNPMSSQFSSRIIKIEASGQYEHLFSFSDVVDFMICVQQKEPIKQEKAHPETSTASSRVRGFLQRAASFGRDLTVPQLDGSPSNHTSQTPQPRSIAGEFQRYCKALIRDNSISSIEEHHQSARTNAAPVDSQSAGVGRDNDHFIPMNMTFVFRNGKIASFEFSEPYTIRTRESQLGRYDYSKIIDITRSGQDLIISILTYLDKLIKVVI